jgi:hypothetical protein
MSAMGSLTPQDDTESSPGTGNRLAPVPSPASMSSLSSPQSALYRNLFGAGAGAGAVGESATKYQQRQAIQDPIIPTRYEYRERASSASSQSTSSGSTATNTVSTGSTSNLGSFVATPPSTVFSSPEKGTPEKRRQRNVSLTQVETEEGLTTVSVEQAQEPDMPAHDPMAMARANKEIGVSVIFDNEIETTDELRIWSGFLIFEPLGGELPQKKFQSRKDQSKETDTEKTQTNLEDPEVQKNHAVLPTITKIMLPDEVRHHLPEGVPHPQMGLEYEAEVYERLQSRNIFEPFELAPRFFGLFDDMAENHALYFVLEDVGTPLKTFGVLSEEQ